MAIRDRVCYDVNEYKWLELLLIGEFGVNRATFRVPESGDHMHTSDSVSQSVPFTLFPNNRTKV